MNPIEEVLQKANLTQYKPSLLELGADDLEQLASLPEQDFQNLLEMVGMAKKPFHVMRFVKAIGRSQNVSDKLICQTSSNSATHTVTVYATQLEEPSSVSNPVQPTSPTQSNYLLKNIPPSAQQTHFVDMLNISLPGSQKKPLLATREQLQSLVDDSIPLQKQLGPSPISPETWDEGRREIFRSASQLFPSSSPLTEEEEMINEAAFQLCLWDPTLLVRQKDLYILSKKLVRQFSLNYNDPLRLRYSKSTDASSFNWFRSTPYPLSRGPDGKFRSCFEENYERREQHIQELQRLLSENMAEEQVKQGLLLQAKEKKDYSLALKLQEQLSTLGKTNRELKAEMSRTRKVQRRSLRHQELKKSKKNSEASSNQETNPSFDTLSTETMATPTASLVDIPPLINMIHSETTLIEENQPNTSVNPVTIATQSIDQQPIMGTASAVTEVHPITIPTTSAEVKPISLVTIPSPLNMGVANVNSNNDIPIQIPTFKHEIVTMETSPML